MENGFDFARLHQLASAASLGDENSPAGKQNAGITSTIRSFTKTHLKIIAAILAIALGASSCWWFWGRANSEQLNALVESEPEYASGAGPQPTAAAVSLSTNPADIDAPKKIAVHVMGAVNKAGVVNLAADSRVADAIKAAGGFSAQACPNLLNLAAKVEDGWQIVVGTKNKCESAINTSPAVMDNALGVGGSGSKTSPRTTGSQHIKINLNTATATELETLPGVGPVMANQIIETRNKLGGRFSSTAQLKNVRGIGSKIYAKLADLVRV